MQCVAGHADIDVSLSVNNPLHRSRFDAQGYTLRAFTLTDS